jgi:hypothetical protein
MIDSSERSSVQIQNNIRTLDAWDRYTPHRNRLTQLVQSVYCFGQGASTDHLLPTIAILGAGNTNDLDLSFFLQNFQKVFLVDLDRKAVCTGVVRQIPVASDRIEIIAPVDVTGRLFDSSHSDIDLLSQFKQSQFDVVLSAGLLSQLLQSIFDTDTVTPAQVDLMQLVRREHLQMIMQATKPNGKAIFVTDVVSSLTVPNLEQADALSLQNLLPQLIATRNFFTGLNPNVLRSELNQLRSLLQPNCSLQYHAPWLWQIGPDKHHLMWGVTIDYATPIISDYESRT